MENENQKEENSIKQNKQNSEVSIELHEEPNIDENLANELKDSQNKVTSETSILKRKPINPFNPGSGNSIMLSSVPKKNDSSSFLSNEFGSIPLI